MDGWPALLAIAEAEVSGAPFVPGDRVLHRRGTFDEAWIVEACEQNRRGDWMVQYGIGNVTASAPAAHLIAVPAGWEDAPVAPAGCTQIGGINEAGRQAKLDHDATDPLYLADLRCWHRAMVMWAERWLRLVDPEAATRAAAHHRAQLADMAGAALLAAE